VLRVLFLLTYFTSASKKSQDKNLIIYSYFLFVWTGRRTASVPEPEYYIQGILWPQHHVI